MDTLRLLAALLRALYDRTPRWIDARTGRTLPLIAGGAPEGDGDGGEEGEGDGADSGAESGAEGEAGEGAEGDGEGDEAGKWRALSRKNEAAAKRERKAREKLEADLKKLQDRDKSEQEKAVEKAREEGRTEAQSKAEAERRADRLEVAVTRQAARGIKTGEGDDAKTVKFADPEDALLRVERGLRNGDIDAEDLYDDEGKVKTDVLSTALAEIASRNPHLVGDGRPRPQGDADTGKGEPANNDLEKMTPEDHARRKYPANK